MTCAYELDIKPLMEQLKLDLIATIQPNDFLLVFDITKKFKLNALYYHLLDLISSNFNDQIQLKYFLKLSFTALFELISKNNSNRNEKILLNRILMWIYYNRVALNDLKRNNNTSQPIIETILKEINFNKIDLDDLNSIIAENSLLIKKVPECLKFLKNIIK